MVIKYYYDFLSQPSRALHMLLRISGRPFEEHQIELINGEHLTDEYQIGVNRFQKVPAIIDGDFKLAESIAILRYLWRRGYIADNLYPSDLYKRALIDEFLAWQHNGVRTSCSLYFRFAWVQDRLFGVPAGPEKIQNYKKRMEADFQLIEETWLQGTKYLIGNDLTVADIFGACEIEQIRITGYSVRDKYPKIAAWIESVRVDFYPHFDEAHQIVCKYESEAKAKM